MPDNNILFSVSLPDGTKTTLNEEQYAQAQDKLFAKFPDAQVARVSSYIADDNDLQDSDAYSVMLPDGTNTVLTSAQFTQNRASLLEKFPDAQIAKVSDMSERYWRPKLDEARAALDAFNQEHGQALNQYESYEYLAQQSEQGEVPNFNSPSHKWLREHEAEYLPLKEQRDALRGAVYNNPIVTKGRKQAHDNAISLREQYLDLASKASSGAERRDYKRAAKLQGDAAKLFAAPGQYDEAGEQNGFQKYMDDYGKGAMHTFSDRDFWTRGLTQIARDIDLYGIRKKIQEAQKAKGAELDEKDFDRIISPSEKAELFAFYNLARAQSDDVIGRANDLSSAFKAGQSATESLGFMAEFLLSQGLANVAGKAMSTSANGFVRWMGRALMSDKALERAASQAAKQGITLIPEMSKLAKVGSELARPLVQGLWHTGTQLSTLSSMAEMMNQTNDEGELNSVGRGLWLGFSDSFVENWSESLGNTMDKGFDLAIGGIGKWGQQTLGGTKFGRMARWALNSPFTQTLKEAGFNGFFGEMLEEWAGNAVRLSTGLMDKDEFKQFASIEQQLEMAASFAPMSLFGLGGQVIGGVRHNKEYNRLSQQVKDILIRNNVSQASIDELFKTKFDTPEDVAAKLAPYAKQVLNSGSETAKEDYKKILQLAEETGIKSFAESMQEIQNQERRNQMQNAISAKTGKFWQDFDSPEAVDENGDPEQIHQVRVVEYADGTRRYITAGVPRLVPVRENDGIEVYREVVDLNAPGGREYATVDENGNKGFISDAEIRSGLEDGTITSDREVMLEEYLQERVEAVDKSEEAKRMQTEIQAKLATVMEQIKQDPNFNMGTPEAPIPAMVTSQDNNGVIVTYNKDGNDYYTSMTWQELGNYLGMPITAKTDAEIADDTAKMQQAALERKDKYNKIPAGTEIIVTMPGAEGDEQVPYKFAKAIYDEGEGSVRIYVADEAGNIMTDRNGEEVWFPEEMVQGLEQLAEQSLTPAEAEKEVVEEVVPEEPESAQQAVVKYTKEDGKVNQTAFIKNEPEEWAKWNDERRQDGGANSKERLSAAISDLDKQIKELNKKKAATANPDDADAIEEQVNELAQRHARLKAIYDGYMARELAAKAAEDATRRAEFEAAAAKKKEEERKAAAKIQDDLKEDASFVELAESYANQKKTYGEKDTYNVGGRKFKGRWVVAEATTPKPSHNPLNDFAPTPGYPIGKAGNSNHYDKDKRAQQITREMSETFDERAVQEPVVVTKHGIVLSGNGRTQARLLAAQQQTDAEYKGYIRDHAKKWGLTAEEVDEYANPILYFELEEDVEYSAALFDAFNRSTSKQQSATETAAKVAQMTSEELVMRLDRLFREIGDSIDNLYKNPEKVNELLNMLQAAGIFNANERARYVDEYGNLSGAGEDLVESVLFGTIFDTSDDAVRSAMNDKAVRRAVTFAFPTLVRLRNLKGELSLIGELTDAVSLLATAKAANGGKAENAVVDYMLQGDLWTGQTPIVKATVQLLAHVLNDGKYGSLRSVLNQYIERAEAANYGQAIFTDEGTIEVETKERILRDVLAHNNINIETYGNTAAAQSGVSANDAVRPASGEQGSSGTSVNGTGESNPAGVSGEGNPAQQVEKKSSIQGLEHLSEKEITDQVYGHLGQLAMEAGKDGFRIKKITIIGSRANGTAKADSDLDVLVEYEGSMPEDGVFNAVNGEPLVIDGIRVDINPINTAKSGTTEQWLKAHPAEAKPSTEQQQEGPVDLLKLAKEQAKKNRKLQKILKRVEKWVNFLGNGAFEIATGIEDVEKIEDAATRQQILDQINAGKIVEGWFANGKAVIYLPNIPNERTLDRKIMHEVISHKGIKGLFEAKGKGEFDKFCDWVWGNLMNNAARSYFLNYPGVVEIKDLRARQRAAADEFLAHCAEEETAVIAQLDEDFWSRLVEALKSFVNDAMGEDIFGEEDNWFADLLKEAAKSVQQETSAQQEETGALFSVAEPINALSEIRSGHIEQLAKAISDDRGTIKVKLEGLTNDEKSQLKDLVVRESNGTFDELQQRDAIIENFVPVPIDKTPITRKDIASKYQGKDFYTKDGMKVHFTSQSIGKLNVPAITESGVANAFDQLLEKSEFAYSQNDFDDKTKKHKQRENVIEYLNYVVKFDNKDDVYYCRITLERFDDGVVMSHGANVKEVEIMEETLQTFPTAPTERRPLEEIAESSDTKLLNFFVFARTGETISNEKAYDIPIKETRFSVNDSEYLSAVQSGDMAKAQELVNKAAEAAGYTGDTDYQGSLAFNGAAPSRNAYYETREERKAAFEDGSFEGDYSLGDFMKAGLDNNDLQWQLDNPIPASARDKATLESIKNLAGVVKGKKGTIKMYRAVPADVTEDSFRNGDWITPSRLYAERHIELQDWKDGRIIEQDVPVDDIWWNGDDINEWGFDDGKSYAYQNTPNNRKILDPVTYDNNGNVIPLSQRFNPENPDVRFSVAPAVREEMEAIKAAAQADGTFMEAPNGKDTNLSEDQWLLVRTKNFKQWFGDWQSDKEKASKILDNNGEPAVCFHGSTWNPEAEEPGDAVFKDSFRGTGSGDNGFFGRGFYFTYQDGSYADGKAARAEANYYGGNITAAFLNIRNPFMFKETLEKFRTGKDNYGSEKESVMILNMVKHFPELVKDYRIDVVDSEGNVSGEITLEEYAKIFEDTYKNKKFIIREGRDERDRNIVELCADPVHHEETINGQKVEWDDYGFRMDMYRPGANEDAQLAYTHYYLTDLNDMWREDHTGVAYNVPSHMFSDLFESEEFTHALKESGYDGVLQSATGDEAVAFKAKQIKSATGNTGEYSETKSDIRFSVMDNPNFREWFKGSKVVNEDGSPMVVYRGANFDPLAQEPGIGVIKPQRYFSPNKEYASRYGSTTRAYYLNIQHPFDVRNKKDADVLREFLPDGYKFSTGPSGALDWAELSSFDLDELIEKHPEYDGMILDEGGEPNREGGITVRGVSYMPFNGGTQVKSAEENNGEYSSTNPDVRFSVHQYRNFVQAQQEQKVPGKQYPEDVADIRFSISKNNRQTIQAWLRKRADLSEAQRDALVKYLESLDNPKLQLATAKWFSQGVIRLPEDMSKVEQAVSVAGKAKVDPLQYGSPMELLEAHAEFQPTEKRINPDDVPTLHKAAEYKEQGVVIYDVDDTEESRQNMRDIINSHFGKEASPWCLLQGDGNGKLTAASAQYWRNYSAYPKQVAFKDGKLLAFSANDREKRLWWDRQDQPHAGIPVTMKMQNDRLGRTATYDLDPETGLLGNQTDVHRGNKQNGTYETWTNDGKTQLSRTQYKNGKRNGLEERWHQFNGERWVRATYKDGNEVEYESWYDNGNPWRVSHYDSDGVKQGEELVYHENGQMAQRWHFKEGRWDGLKERWNPEGILIERTEFKEGRRHGTEERWFDMGEKMSVTHYDNGLKNGLMEEWYWNGNKRSEIMYDHDFRIGVSKTWHESGNPKSRAEYDDGGNPHGVSILYHDMEGAIYTREHWNHGERHGLSEQFRPDGQIALREHWNNGKRDGLSERWFDNGVLAERKTYKDGKENGEKCMWDSGGRLWYHYEMKDGNEVRNLGGINMPGTARFSVVTDKEELARLEKEPTITLYRAMELIDGELYPPMSQKVPNAKEDKGKKMQRREGVRPGMWQKADEDPAKAYQKEPNGPWYYDLKKLGKKSDVNGVLYNPYLHLSASPLNDQFTSASSRPNLVTVACEVPISELSSGYKAEKANDSVGAKDWHSGTVTAQLGEGRQVVLSRWAKISRIVPDSEVAAMMAPKLIEKNIVVPTNVVTPSLKAALEARGVKFVEPDGEDVRFSVRQGTLFTADGEAVRYQSEGGLPKQEGRTSYVERTYRNRGDFSFMGKDKIETSGDVAYIFKELETSAVENSFIVYVKDGVPTILHTGIGNIESVGIDETAFAAGLNDFAPDEVYMVHNHPSGRVEASRADISMLEVLQRMAGKVPVKGVIIDTLSGQYGEFSYNSFPNTKVNEAAKENEGYTPLEVKAFDKMVFRPQYRANLNEGVTDSKAVASFLSAHRLGDGSKVGALLLDHAMHVVGNLVLNENRITNDNAKALAGQIINAAVHSTASSVVLFGDFAYDKMSLAVLRSELGSQSGNRVGMVDVVRVEGNHTRSLADGTLADSVRFSVANNHERIFISNASKAVEDIKMEKATPEQWLKMLEKSGGLKAGEDKWIGLSDWLKSQNGTVTKQQVLDYIHQNQIQIEENRYSENADMVAAWEKEFQKTIARGKSLEELQKEIDELIESPQYYDELGNEPIQDDIDAYLTRAMREEYGDDFDRGYTINDGVIDYNIDPYEVDESDFMEFFADDPSVEKPINSVRLNYTTTGLDNKREIALTVPTIESWNKGDQVHFGDAGEGRAIVWIRFGDTVGYPAGADADRMLVYLKVKRDLDRLEENARGKLYRGVTGKMREEYEQRLADVERMREQLNEQYPEFADARIGRVLVIDEIQSKRHQEAREQGYRNKDAYKSARVGEFRKFTVGDENFEEADVIGRGGQRLGKITKNEDGLYYAENADSTKVTSSRRTIEEALKAMDDAFTKEGIPDAPFEKNWYELAMKRMLRLAADEGYDYIAWTTGEQQAERYDLSRVIHGIRVYPAPNDTYTIVTESRDMTEQETFYEVSKNKLSDYIGKELANRVINGDNKYYDKHNNSDVQIFRGIDLKVGGEGMKGFYDEILPRFMNKYGKKWGVKVEDIALPALEESAKTMHSVPVTQEMKDSVMEGQVMFSVTEKPHSRGVADPRFMVPKVRGGWTEKKILRYLKDFGSHYGLRSAAAAISEFDSPEELKRHMFYHGTTNWVKQLRPSIIRSDRWVEQYGGGGYGDKYWGISLTKNKKVATNFSGATSRTVNVYPVILRKGATVIERPDFTDAWDAGEHIVELWEQGVDAVWIGNKDAGEEELLVLNPLAIVNIGAEDRYNVYQLGTPQNPVNIASDADIKKMYDTAMEFFNADAPHRPMKPSRWDFDTDRRKSDAEYDAEMQEYERRMEEYEKSDEKRAYDELKHRAERDIRFSVANQNEEVFISNAQKAVEGIAMEKATPQQWLKMIEGKGGLKAGEDKWIGLSAWLNSMKEADVKSLTKDQVLRYIKATKIRIEDANYAYAPMFSQNSLRNLESELKTRGESSIEDVLSAWDREFNDNKLEQYQQGLFSVNENNEIETAEPLAMPINKTRLKFTSEGLKNKREIALVVPTVEPYGQYDQVHFGDAGYGRAIAWVRFGDAVDPETGARVLFIDEIQSKRHQDARERGYRGELPDYEKPIIYPQNLQIAESQYKYHTTFKGKEYSVGKGVVSGIESAKKYLADYINSQIEERNKELSNRRYTAVPDAPFERNWHELAMKRMLRLAAEEGYDYVAWTTGDQQADRYNLGQVVNTIERSREFDDGEVRYDMYDKEGVGRGVFVKDGIITKSYYDELAGKRIEEVFGKGLSQKMLSLKDGEKISGEDIRVAGGEGMRGFYDEILPRFMNKYGKKWGVSVDNDGLVDASGILYPAHVVPVTEDMKRPVMQGQVMFSVRAADEARESGIGGVIGQENVGEFYMSLYSEMPKEMRKPIVERAMSNGMNIRKATEDYISELAVKGDEPTGLLRMAENQLSEYAGEEITDNVARYILWRGSEGVNNGLLLDVAHDQFMRNHLDVANPQVRFSVSDSVKEADTEAENVVDEAKEQLRKDKKELKDLLTAAKAMGLQKEYDKKTVEAVTNLAKRLLQEQYIDQLSRREVSRLLGIVRTSVGRAPKTVKKNADAIVEIVIDNLLKREKEALKALTNGTGAKTNTTGVEVAGELDVQGQKTLKAYKEGIKLEVGNVDDSDDMNTLYGMRARLQSRLSSKDDAVRKEAEAEDAGLALAIEYKESIKALLDEEKSLEEDLKDAAAALKDGDMSKTDYEEFVRATQDAIRENHIEQVDSYKDFRAKMQEMLSGSREAKRAFMEREKERIENIHHLANSDMQGRDASKEKRPTFKDKLANSPIVRFFAAPLATFDQMLRLFGEKNIAGEGYLWNKYMRGWLEAAEKAYIGQRDAKAALDKKASEVFGKDMLWSDIFDMERKMPKATVKWWDDGAIKEHELSQGQLLYIYMVNKMADGRMKLRKMGIDEAAVEAIKRNMDSRFLELADWLQEEYLVDLRNKYNAVHERLFGASMAAIENYFPLKINKRDLTRNEDIAAPDYESLPSTTTGSIIKRRRNSKALDLLNADAFSVVIEHIEQMEQWAAFAEFNKDVNALLSYKRFRNQVQNMASVYGSGTTLWHNFKDVMRIAGNAYHPQVGRNQLDTAAVNLAKGVTSAKISFRVYTALKQFLSMPAFVADANIGYLTKDLATPWKAWNWAMENLPVFEKRWKSRIAGDTRLMSTEDDWRVFRSKMYDKLSKWGMSPNAFVDAWAVAVGAHAMYQTRYNRYIKEGFSEEQADKKAKQDATVLYNETQQSNENAFVSAAQLDRTVFATAITVFRNSSMGFQRQVHDAIRNLGKHLRPGYKEQSIEFMTKQLVREGLSEEKAKEAAERRYNRSLTHDAVRLATFGFLVEFAWNLGGSLAYLLFGDDDDEKEKMLAEAFKHALIGGSMEGLSAGNVMSDAINMVAKGENLRNYDPTLLPILSDMKRVYSMMSYDPVAGANDLVNLAVQAGIGVNPQTFTDAVVAVVDACNGDMETSREAMLLILRVLQVPQSQIDQIYIDELGVKASTAKRMSPTQMAKRYADYKFNRNAPLTKWAYPEELEEKRKAAHEKRFKKLVKERKEDK